MGQRMGIGVMWQSLKGQSYQLAILLVVLKDCALEQGPLSECERRIVGIRGIVLK